MDVRDKMFEFGPSGITYRPAGEYDCVEVGASTPEKFNQRWLAIKECFPDAEVMYVKMELGMFPWYIIKLGEPNEKVLI